MSNELDEPESAPQPEPRARGISADGRLTSGKLAGFTMDRAIWVLTWPILLESVLGALVGLTDTVLASGIDDGGASTDAVGGAAYVLWVTGLIVSALGIGATALISRAVGAGRFAVANAAVGQSVILALCTGLVVGAALALLTPAFASLLSLKGRARDAFEAYMLILAAGVPLHSFVYGIIACVRGAGDSKTPFHAFLIINAVNLVASWILAGVDLRTARVVDGATQVVTILRNPFDFDLGVAGIGLGTVLGYLAGALFMLWVMARGVGGVRLRRHWLAPHRATIARLWRVGFPNFLEMAGMWAGNFLIILFVGWLGAAQGGALGAHVIAIRIEAFSYLPGFAFGSAAATLVGQYLGAGSASLARKAAWRCTLLAAAFMGCMSLFLLLMPRTLVGLISAQEIHLSLAPPLLIIAGAVQIPFALSIVMRQVLRGAGDVNAAMWITWITTYGVRLPLAYLLSGVDIPLPGGEVITNPWPWDWGLAGLWAGLCLEILVRCAMFWARFAKGAWLKTRV